MRKVVNTCIIDTIYGNRTINLIKSDISESNDEMIVFSTSESKQNVLDEQGYKLLKSKYKLNGKCHDISSTKINGVSMEYFDEKHDQGIMSFLMVHMPGGDGVEDNLAIHDKNIKAIFAYLKALEFNDNSFRSISLPMIGGISNTDYFENIKILLKYSIKYLKESKSTEIIDFYIKEDEEEVSWNNAFEKTLGRTYYKQGSLLIIETLKRSLKDTITTIFQSGNFNELEYILNLIYRELEEVDSLSINNIAINSRKISEIIAKQIASKKQVNIYKIKYDLSAIINLIASKDIIAPWAIQYLHTARVFGNKTAHVETLIKYQPNRIYTDDFISILTTLYNMLWFWYYNKDKI